jgi:2-keto-4-pentenoate hydratase/2-oxohepta-3-ene-1,7-dioic acid hydratase in catechol pathway
MDRLYRVVQPQAEPFYAVERDGELRRAAPVNGNLFGGYTVEGVVAGGLAAVRTLAPVLPSKILCIGLNYKDHAAEVKKALPADPLLFIKPPTAVLNPGDAIKLPPQVGRVDYEGELAVVIGRKAHRVSRANAWDYIFGLTCLNDVTARELQIRDVQYTRAKGFDTFAPLGPCIAVGAPGTPRTVETWLNGTRRQASTTAQLIFDIDLLVEFVSFVMTLEPGDIISTGTPAGIGPLKHGDLVTVNVEGIGELTNRVEEE